MSQDRVGNEGLAFVLLILGGTIAILLYAFDELVTIPWAAYRYIDSTFWSHMIFLPDSVLNTHRNILHSLSSLPSWKSLEYRHVYKIEYMVMWKTTWLYLLIPIPLILRVVRKKRDIEKYQKRLNYDELLEQETVIWRYNRYLIKNNPTKEGLDVFKGRFAGRETVLNGLKRTECFLVDRENNRVTLNTARAKQVFAQQIEFPISKVEDIYELPFEYKFCICVFGLRQESLPPVFSTYDLFQANLRLKFFQCIKVFAECLRLRKLQKKCIQISTHYAYGDYKTTAKIEHSLDFNEDVRFQLVGDYSYHLNGELDFEWVKKMVDHILPKVLNLDSVQDLLKQHAYAITFTRRLLFEARSLGKLGPSQFGFIKIVNRQLWYALNDEGLAGSSFEATGIKSHYMWELKTKRAQIFPMLDQCFSYHNGLNLPKNCDEYDTIEIPLHHPLSTAYPNDPNIEKQEHLKRLNEDPKYRLQQTQIRQVIDGQ